MNDYRSIGLKLTPQRMAILHYLDGNKQHPSAEAIYTAIRKRFPTMSFATVYATLAALKKKGAVLELTIDPDKKRYDPQVGGHDHLICVACKRIVDIPSSTLPVPPAGHAQDFEIFSTRVEFHGLCPKCKTSETSTDQGGSVCA